MNSSARVTIVKPLSITRGSLFATLVSGGAINVSHNAVLVRFTRVRMQMRRIIGLMWSTYAAKDSTFQNYCTRLIQYLWSTLRPENKMLWIEKKIQKLKNLLNNATKSNFLYKSDITYLFHSLCCLTKFYTNDVPC